MRIYLAGPLFTLAEQRFNEELARALKRHKHEVWLPQEKCKHLKTEQEIFSCNVQGVDTCQALVGNCDGMDMDSGTAWEIGRASMGTQKIILFRTDFRKVRDMDHFNIMLVKSAHKVLYLPFKPLEIVALEIHNALVS